MEEEYIFNNKKFSCPVELALSVISGKWKIFILYFLNQKTYRNGELRKVIPQITQKMLTQHLRELEADGLILRTVYPVVPPKVEYNLTDQGKAIQPILIELCKFGDKLFESANGQPTGFDCK